MATDWRIRIGGLLLILLLCGQPSAAQGPPADLSPQRIIEEQIDAVPTHDIDAFLEGLDADLRQRIPSFDLRRMVLDPEGGLRVDVGGMFRALLSQLASEVLLGSGLLAQLVVLAILCALIQSLASAFGNKGIHDVALLVTMMAVLVLGVQAFRTAAQVADTTIGQMVSFMHVLLPVLATLLAAVGGLTSAAIFHPMLMAIVTIVATLVNTVLFPLVFVGVVLAVFGKLSDNFPINRLAGLVRQWSLTILGLLFIVFMGVLSVRGAIGPVADGLGIRTAKFLTGTFIPVVGGRLADALEVVVGGSLLIKNAVGAFGLLTVFTITAFPALKILSLLVIFRVVTALVEPISDTRFTGALSALGDGLALVLACVLTVALMFFIGVTVLVTVGNMTVVMR